MTTKITGIVRDLEGQPLANSMLRFERRSGVRAQDGATIVPRVVNAKTDAGGNLAVELYPGEYRAQAERGAGALTFSVGVPEDVAQVDLQDLLDQVPAITPMWASETRQARDEAVEAAESTAGSAEAAEDSASLASASADAASDSAGTAQLAEGGAVDARDKAQEWAENPEDDEVEAGAFSAKHHAEKAAQSAAISPRVIYVDTIADLQALNTSALPDGQQVSVAGGDYPADFIYAKESAAAVDNWTILAPESGDGRFLLRSGVLATDLTVAIPSDFPDLQTAVDRLSVLRPAQGATVFLNVDAGHNPTSGVAVENGDYGHFEITSSDAEVLVGAGWGDQDEVVLAVNARAPVLASLWNCDGRGLNGYRLLSISTGFVKPGCGVKNVKKQPPSSNPGSTQGSGLLLSNSSEVRATGSIFTGNWRNFFITTASKAEIANAVLTGADNGEHGDEAAGAFISRSCIVHMSGADVSGSDHWGVRSYRGLVTANNIKANNCAVRAMELARCGFFVAQGAEVIGSGRIVCTGMTLDMPLAVIEGANDRGIDLREGARLQARGISITGSGTNALVMAGGSWADLTEGTLSGSGGLDITMSGGCEIIGHDLTTTTGDILADTNIPVINEPYSGGIFRSILDNNLSLIKEASGNNTEGYFVRGDGYARAFKRISLARSDGDNVIISMPVNFNTERFSCGFNLQDNANAATTTHFSNVNVSAKPDGSVEIFGRTAVDGAGLVAITVWTEGYID